MNVIPVLVICSLFLALCAVALFVWSAGRGDQDYADSLSLLPLESDLLVRDEQSSPDTPPEVELPKSS